MLGSFFVVIFLGIIVELGKWYKKQAKENITIKRVFTKDKVNIGEEVYMDLILENRSKKMAPYIYIEQNIPKQVFNDDKVVKIDDLNNELHSLKCSLLAKTRLIDRIKLSTNKRGAYIFKSIEVTFGDFFGFSFEDDEIVDFKELLVLPSYENISNFRFKETSDLGEIFQRRWINPDPIFIKGVRPYTYGDSFKSIHWKQTVKAGKLMSKVFDYTTEQAWVIVFNPQCSEEHFDSIKMAEVEKAISLCASIVNEMDKQGLKVGYLTNARLLSAKEHQSNYLAPDRMIVDEIFEYLSRTDYFLQDKFETFLKSFLDKYPKDYHYLFVSMYQNKTTDELLEQFAEQGYSITLIQCYNNLSDLKNIKVYTYEGEEAKNVE